MNKKLENRDNIVNFVVETLEKNIKEGLEKSINTSKEELLKNFEGEVLYSKFIRNPEDDTENEDLDFIQTMPINSMERAKETLEQCKKTLSTKTEKDLEEFTITPDDILHHNGHSSLKRNVVEKYANEQLSNAGLMEQFDHLCNLASNNMIPKDIPLQIKIFIFDHGINKYIENMLNSIISLHEADKGVMILNEVYAIYSKELGYVIKTFLFCKDTYDIFKKTDFDINILNTEEKQKCEVCIHDNSQNDEVRIVFNHILTMVSNGNLPIELIDIDVSKYNENDLNRALDIYNKYIENHDIFKLTSFKNMYVLSPNKNIGLYMVKYDKEAEFCIDFFNSIFMAIDINKKIIEGCNISSVL